MAVNETIVTGRKWRRCIDVANKLWQRISYWTKASDVEFDDGQTAETKMGAISGITSDLNGESENVAASIKAVNQLNNNLAQQPIFIYDSSGKITGYKTKVGADSVFPFSGSTDSITLLSSFVGAGGINSRTISITSDFEGTVICVGFSNLSGNRVKISGFGSVDTPIYYQDISSNYYNSHGILVGRVVVGSTISVSVSGETCDVFASILRIQ